MSLYFHIYIYIYIYIQPINLITAKYMIITKCYRPRPHDAAIPPDPRIPPPIPPYPLPHSPRSSSPRCKQGMSLQLQHSNNDAVDCSYQRAASTHGRWQHPWSKSCPNAFTNHDKSCPNGCQIMSTCHQAKPYHMVDQLTFKPTAAASAPGRWQCPWPKSCTNRAKTNQLNAHVKNHPNHAKS